MSFREREPLLIDRAAAAARADDHAVREWAEDQRVFVSSVIDGYEDYRKAAIEAITELGAAPIAFERFGGRDSNPHEAYLSEVRSSTIYIGLLGATYGRPLADRYSATHREFLEAEQTGLRTSVWVQDGAEREGPQQSFVDAVRAFQVTGSYSTPEQLRRGLGERLRVIAGEEISPWVKLGNLVFRATEVSERGGIAVVRASVRDPGVATALRTLGDRAGRRRLPFSYADRVLVGEPRQLSATTRAGRSVEFEVELATAKVDQPTRINFNGVAWEQLTETAIGVSIYSEPNPFGLMRHMVEIPNPLPALRATSVPEEALRPIARLLLSEVLVTERGIERVTEFALGQPVGGRRRLRIAWRDRPPYAGQPSPAGELDGDIDW